MYCIKQMYMYILKLNHLRKAKDNKQNQAEKQCECPYLGSAVSPCGYICQIFHGFIFQFWGIHS